MASTVEVVILGVDSASTVIGGIGGALSNLGNIVTGIKSAFDLLGGAWDAAVGFAQPFIDSASESQIALSGLDTVLRSTSDGAGLFTETVGKLSQTSLLGLQVELDHAKDKLGEMKDAFGNVKSYTDEETLAIMLQKEKISQLTAEIERGANGQIIYRDTTQLSRDALLDLAAALQDVTKFSDEEVTAAEAMMLRFENVNANIFPEAIRLTTDLATSLGTDLTAAARVVGMALDNPEQGIGRLNMQFRIFNDTEMQTIKNMAANGDIAGAQALIIQALTEKVGGAAEAYGKTFAGALDIAKNKLDNIRETIGGAVLPVLTDLITKITEFASKPEVIAFFENLGKSISGFLTGLDLGGKLTGFLDSILTAMKTGDWTPVWDSIKNAITGGWDYIAPIIDDLFARLFNWMEQKVSAWIDSGGADRLGNKIMDALNTTIASPTFQGKASIAAQSLVETLGKALGLVDWGAIWGGIGDKISGFFAGIWGGIDWGAIGIGFMDMLNYVVLNALDIIFPWFNIGKDAITGFFNGLNSIKTDWNKWATDNIIDPIKKFLGIASPSTIFTDIGKNIIQGLVNGIESLKDWAVGAITGIVAAILAPFKTILDLLGIDTSFLNVSTGSIGGHNTGGTTTDSTGGTGSVVNQYFQGANIYVGSWDEIAYDCIYPNPFVAATSGQLGGGGGGAPGSPK